MISINDGSFAAYTKNEKQERIQKRRNEYVISGHLDNVEIETVLSMEFDEIPITLDEQITYLYLKLKNEDTDKADRMKNEIAAIAEEVSKGERELSEIEVKKVVAVLKKYFKHFKLVVNGIYYTK